MNRREFFNVLAVAYISKFYKPAETWGAVVRSEIPQFHGAHLYSNGFLDKNVIYFMSNVYITNPAMCSYIDHIKA